MDSQFPIEALEVVLFEYISYSLNKKLFLEHTQSNVTQSTAELRLLQSFPMG